MLVLFCCVNTFHIEVNKAYLVVFKLSCSFCMCPLGGPQAAYHCQTAVGPSLGVKRLQQPCRVAQ